MQILPAAESGAANVVEYLVKTETLKLDLNVADTDGHTPLILVCGVPKEEFKVEHIKCVQLLLEAGANPNAVDGAGCTALHYAVLGGHIEFVKLLLKQPALQVNKQDQDERVSALHIACRHPHLQPIALLLLSSGADINLADAKGRTPLQIAQRYGVKLSTAPAQSDTSPAKKVAAAPSAPSGASPTAIPAATAKPTASPAPSAPSAPSPVPTTPEDMSIKSALDENTRLQAEIEKELANT